MAGQPRKRALVAEIERRTREQFEDETSTHLDYVCAWIASGRTMTELTQEIIDGTGYDILPAMLGNYLRAKWGDEARHRLKEARQDGAHGMADQSVAIADEAVADSADAARARNRLGARQWIAERWGREEYGPKVQQGPTVNVNLGSMHLDALRARARSTTLVVDAEATASPRQLAPGATASATTEAEVVEEHAA